MAEKYGLLLFESTSSALKAERDVKDAGVSCAVIPAPLEFSAGCGIALLIKDAEVERAARALEGRSGHRLKYPYVR